ncbi:DUF2868 domain-containing protein [Marinobacter sp. ELB17]|uniref:DUF2868 domain-containing protein n=1 Tax=Marinobacter sp. ELB17 TaxID=270374 RepID=UPI0000F374DA|nr:DUF2868 domain-containing protein [Marinobacter sp. ELB17]EBA00853.1 hypothetical protein MELB17_23490 [Marinobacter sp. ELB17]
MVKQSAAKPSMTKTSIIKQPLCLLMNFDAQIQRDGQQASDFVHRRDRKFALNCEEHNSPSDPAHWLAWLRRFDNSSEQFAGPGQSIEQHWQRINSVFIALGAVLGIITMAGLLFYDGGQRINVTVIIGFVALQLLLALLTSLQSVMGWQPWRPLLNRFVPAPSPALQPLQPALMARAAQGGGLSFAVTALLTLLAMVVTQDLAFGWSTTLNTAASGYHQLTSALATPWAWLWPAAVPDLTLVEATRFFRAGTNTSLTPARWGQWWPFISMLWLVWVVLPRLLLRLHASAFVRLRARTLLRRHPGLNALRGRMATPVLDTGAGHNDANDLPDTRHNTLLQPLSEKAHLLSWAGAGTVTDKQALPSVLAAICPGPALNVGGLASLSQDQQAIAQLAASSDAVTAIMLVRSWEPPTGELLDFLTSARQSWPAGSRVCLLPLEATARQPSTTAKDRQLQPWLRFAERCPPGFVTVGDIAISTGLSQS